MGRFGDGGGRGGAMLGEGRCLSSEQISCQWKE